ERPERDRAEQPDLQPITARLLDGGLRDTARRAEADHDQLRVVGQVFGPALLVLPDCLELGLQAQIDRFHLLRAKLQRRDETWVTAVRAGERPVAFHFAERA